MSSLPIYQQHKFHNSGVVAFRRCRRKWDLTTRKGWYAITESEKLWTGSAMHAGLQAYHSTNPPNPKAIVPAIDAYFERRRKGWTEEPVELPDVRQQLIGMMRYYHRHWLAERDPLETVIIDGAPLVEVPFAIKVEVNGQIYLFEGEFDRVVREDGLIWVVDYKSAMGFNTDKLTKDSQCSTYIWAAKKVLGHLGEIGGMIYQQHRKAVPEPPEPLKRGGFTQAKNKLGNTTAALYEQALNEAGIPLDYYVEVLDLLRANEMPDADPFIRRDRVTRTPEEVESFEEQLKMLAEEYFDKEIAIYPNPTNDCSWDCDFKVVCDVMQNKGDHEDVLRALFTKEKPSK